MPWWVWMLLGMALLVAELALPTDFFLFFFGLSALLVGIDGPLLRIDDDLEGDDARKHVDEPLTAAQPQAQARATRLASGSPA